MDRVYNYLLGRTDKQPIEYIEFVYRREMHITPQELDEMPAAVFLRDIQFMSTEARAREWMRDS